MEILLICTIIAAIPAGLYIAIQINAKNLEKLPLVEATIIKCTRAGTPTNIYYELVYEFIDNNGSKQQCTDRVMYDAMTPKEVGIVYKMYLGKRKNGEHCLIDKETVERSKGAGALFIFSGGALLIGVLGALATLKGPAGVIAIYASAGLCVAGALGFGIKAIMMYSKTCKNKTDEFTRKIPAKIIGFNRRLNGPDDINVYNYYPIYEYTMNGKTELFESPYAVLKKRQYPVGKTVTLHYNTKTNFIFEERGKRYSLGVGIGFLLVGIFMLGVLLWSAFANQ